MGVALGIVAVGSAFLFLGDAGRHLVIQLTYNSLHSFTLSAIPVFILMGELLFHTGLSERLYNSLMGSVTRLPGGLLHANVMSCAVFAAACGSSVAEVAAMGTVAIPSLEQKGYKRQWAMGSLAAAGSLGMMIPPSIPLIIYGFMTDTSVAKLFVAGVIPGIILALMFSARIGIQALWHPDSIGGTTEKASFKEIFRRLSGMLPSATLILIVLGSIYMGIATPTEAAGVGVLGALVIASLYRNLNWQSFCGAVKETVILWGMIAFIMVGAQCMSYSLSYLRVGARLTEVITSLPVPPLVILFGLYLMYIAMGCIMDAVSLILVTVPICFPIVISLGFDPIWFGIALVVLLEIAVVTPPVGCNLWVLQGLTGESMGSVSRSVLPFFYVMLVFLLILTFLPELATWLPSLMF